MIKRFENFFHRSNITPEIGDYIFCRESGNVSADIREFIDNNVGKYVKYNSDDKSYPYILVYNNIPEDLYDTYFGVDRDIPNGRHFASEELIRFATDDEIAEYESSKFNL